ncbi:Altronate dehydratase [bioreactor metagenome]|uniref:Altronate dehydratase n=1 Tax=bioreactor metagenome TaxID=1076179 RepID=A0A645J265_9ZZZZ
MIEVLALKVHDCDNVAVIFAENVEAGMKVLVRDKKGNLQSLILKTAVPYGHKIAVADIPAGTPILKYGEEIGLSTKDITVGEHVHIHNLESRRGRGDLNKG